MVDDLTPMDSMPPVGGDSTLAGEGKTGFLSTTAGKVIVIGAALFAFLVVAGIVTFVVVTFVFVDAVGDTAEELANEVATAPSGEDSSKDATSAVAIEPSPVPLSSIFTFRDVFDPLIDPTPAEETSGTTGTTGSTDGTDGTTDGLFSGQPDTLYLQDIVVDNGVSRAVLYLNGQMYSLAEGESVPGTPWLVLSINSGSVTMLYGDSQVTLVVGQGVASK